MRSRFANFFKLEEQHQQQQQQQLEQRPALPGAPPAEAAVPPVGPGAGTGAAGAEPSATGSMAGSMLLAMLKKQAPGPGAPPAPLAGPAAGAANQLASDAELDDVSKVAMSAALQVRAWVGWGPGRQAGVLGSSGLGWACSALLGSKLAQGHRSWGQAWGAWVMKCPSCTCTGVRD